MLRSVYIYIYIYIYIHVHYSPLLVYVYTYYIHIRIYTYYTGCRGGRERRRGGGGCRRGAGGADQSDGKSTSSPEAKATRDARVRGPVRERVMARAVCTLYLNNRARTAGGAHTRVLSRTSAGVGGVAWREVRIEVQCLRARARACVRLERRRGGNAVPPAHSSGPLLTSLPPPPTPLATPSPTFRVCIHIPLRPLARRPALSVNGGVRPDRMRWRRRWREWAVSGLEVAAGGGGHYVT